LPALYQVPGLQLPATNPNKPKKLRGEGKTSTYYITDRQNLSSDHANGILIKSKSHSRN
jgi:hypothetical protein